MEKASKKSIYIYIVYEAFFGVYTYMYIIYKKSPKNRSYTKKSSKNRSYTKKIP